MSRAFERNSLQSASISSTVRLYLSEEHLAHQFIRTSISFTVRLYKSEQYHAHPRFLTLLLNDELQSWDTWKKYHGGKEKAEQ